MSTRLLSLLAVVGAIVAACSCGTTNASVAMPEGRPRVLHYAFTSTSEDPDAAGKRAEIIRAYLSKALHMEVEMTRTSNSYSSVIEAFRANKIDVASISPFSYVIATRTIPIEAFAMRGKVDGEPGEYTGSLAVPNDSPIHSIDDLKSHVKDLTISFVDPASASGFLVQRAYFQSIGIDPERDFKRVTFSMSHPASAMTLKSHKVDVAAMGEKMIKRYVDAGKLRADDYRLIWSSPNIPNQPFALRKGLPAEFKKEIQRAFLEMAEKDPLTFRNMNSKLLTLAPDDVYVAANDQMFDGLREMVRGIQSLNISER